MPTRRPTDDDDEPGPTRRKKRKRKKEEKRSILPIVFLGLAIVAFLAVGIIVLTWSNKPRERDQSNGTVGTNERKGGSAGVVAGANLLTNGSFEEGPEPDAGGPGFTPTDAGSTVIRGWNVTRGSVDYIGPYWQHADGRRSIDLNGNEPGSIAQTFATKTGKKYRVTFSMAGNNCGDGPTLKTVAVSAAGSQAEFSFDTAGRSYEDMGWATKTWEFTATATETTLEFASTTLDTPACGPALDRVSVVEIGT